MTLTFDPFVLTNGFKNRVKYFFRWLKLKINFVYYWTEKMIITPEPVRAEEAFHVSMIGR